MEGVNMRMTALQGASLSKVANDSYALRRRRSCVRIASGAPIKSMA